MPALKIALIGSAPSSVGLAPYGDPSWQIFGCSPGVYPHARRVTAWIELHRWEPGVIGCPETQKPWFSPEYVGWMAKLPLVWMAAPVREIPGSRALPVDTLTARWGTNWFTSSVAYMMAMSMDSILDIRARRAAGTEPALLEGEKDAIALYGVDMAATEEYGYQRAGCQYFIMMADLLGINVVLPAESDLLRPMPLYGIMESSHWHIKNTARKRELEGRLAGVTQSMQNCMREEAFLRGALDDLKYQMDTWCEDRVMSGTLPEIFAQSPELIEQVKARLLPDPVVCAPVDVALPAKRAKRIASKK
tara:strand:- start:25744 stop:26658 length:915 start_codon:yes stop_codon:yes gene_type:complete